MALMGDAKFEEKLSCGLENEMKYEKFWPEHLKISKLGLWWDLLSQSRKCLSLKSTDELCVMTMKDAKCEEKLSCHFRIDIRNLTNFDLSTWKSQKFHFNVLLLSKVYIVWAKKSTEELSFMTLKSDAKFEEKITFVLEITWGTWEIFTRDLKVSKLELWCDPFVQSRKCTSLKFTEGLCIMAMKNDMCHDNKKWYKNWRGAELLFSNWYVELPKLSPKHFKV